MYCTHEHWGHEGIGQHPCEKNLNLALELKKKKKEGARLTL